MKVYNELRSMSPFNPLYSSVRSQCKANLEKVRSHESMSVEMFQEIQHTLSDVTFLLRQITRRYLLLMQPHFWQSVTSYVKAMLL